MRCFALIFDKGDNAANDDDEDNIGYDDDCYAFPERIIPSLTHLRWLPAQ